MKNTQVLSSSNMKRNKKKGLIVMVLSILILSLQTTSTFADVGYSTFNDHVLKSGISNIQYYVDSSASDYKSLIKNAFSDWKTAVANWEDAIGEDNVSIGYILKSSINNTTIRIDAVNDDTYPNNKNNAWTWFCNSNGRHINQYNQDWTYNTITINTYNTAKKSNSLKKGIIAHELGHCFGLDEHNSMRASIMCQSSHNRSVTTPQECDAMGVADLWSGK